MGKAKESLCASCLYGSQPFCYYPFVCVAGKRIKEYWHDILSCKKYKKAPDPPELPKGTAWIVIKGGKFGEK